MSRYLTAKDMLEIQRLEREKLILENAVERLKKMIDQLQRRIDKIDPPLSIEVEGTS